MHSRRITPTDRRRQVRRVGLLVAGLTAASLVVLVVAPVAWPVFALPVFAAFPLAGREGLAICALWSAAVFGVVAGRPGVEISGVVVGWCAFVAASAVVGTRYGRVQQDLTRVVGASLRDRLTGLYNFAFFSDAVRREAERSTRYGSKLTLVLFDLDGFKSFNDTHGHEAGNRLLAEVGAVIERTRRSADIAARFGGEEFALLVPGGVTAAVEAAERIRLQIARIIVPVGNGQHDGRTISAGVAGYRPGDPTETLIEAADRALYLSKRRGRNRVSVSGETPLPRAAGA